MLKQFIANKQLIISLAKREVATQYIGSMLGIVWAFVHPLVMILVFWFIFSVGFKVQPIQDVPFVVWLTAGMAPWFYFTEIVNGSTSVVVSNTNLVKKMLFPSEILPLVKVVSCLVSHVFFIAILFFLMVFQGLEFSGYFFQGFYYLFCLWILVLGISWTIAALNVFMRDISHLVAVVIQVGFWGTPIFWNINIMPEKIQFLLKFNPVYYIVQGYRESFIYFTPFWHHPLQSLYFWSVSMTLFLGGAALFLKLKPQFADVL
jgi:lipopolysaccharide transport system permease protein/teichoic acid transport system permease protein